MRIPRIFATASFRLAALYAALFAGSIVVLGAVVFWTTHSVLDQQVRNRIATEVSTLQAGFRAGGIDALVAAVRDRDRASSALDYRVQNAVGKRLAGHLPSPGDGRGWIMLQARDVGIDKRDSIKERVEARVVPLDGGALLVVGDDRDRVRHVDDAILDAFKWALGVTLMLGITGGLILSAGFLRRVDAIAQTAEAIIDGDLTRRVPERQTADELDRLAHTFNRMLDRIAGLMESMRQISSDVAHDLRTPLTRLRQDLESTRSGVRSAAEYQSAIDAAVVETDALLDTFGALLRITQIESGTRRAGFADVDLSGLVETVAAAFMPSAEDAGQRIIVSVSSECRIHGDRELLTRMLANLIENAIGHTPTGTAIAIGLAINCDRAKLVVADNGPGVPAVAHERILRRFYRLEHSRSTPGSGLGLSLVAAIAELHDAEITIDDNRPGLRATVAFAAAATIPAREPRATDVAMSKADNAKPTIFSRARQWARDIKRDVHALWLAARDPRTPWYAKLLALSIAAYALSPIDLIPDFIPVIGYLDDIVIVPLGILLALRLIPSHVMADCREKANLTAGRPASRVAAGVFVTIWVACAVALYYWLIR